ncbi:MAG: hypothetical protein DIZ80_09930 [endosymbiont of Galathealinum brachiosum]|uniref:Uncharacterized protein n=1 Tax=endosymbiont of Galathealinum brachiosum TaxID=2200906 RepID=A0A370DDY5_9GAMM|nr:MAG: hypothetical protein DIZ80_09930 [endosymbiont of Galathealinum brachiosum]
MVGVTNKRVVGSILGILLVVSNFSSFAGVNPFKKSKNYTFGADAAWYENNNTAIKSGSVRDGSDTNYYHLNIDKYRLLLRMGKNDPSGELENTRLLDGLAIAEIKTDGRRLPIFNWCLQNQQNPGKKLKQNAIVANDVCINAGGGGDFVINLDKESHNILKSANVIEFIIEPYGRPVKLTFTMSGYAPLMAKINKPVPPPAPVVKKVEPKPAPVVVAKPKPRPKPKPVKMCYARPPIDFKSAVPAIAYPCKNEARKSNAETKISARVEHEKKKMAAELKAADDEKLARQKSVEDNKREAEWDAKQSALWVSRCERHWAKNRSPCYCEKYMDQAPEGVVNTCGK